MSQDDRNTKHPIEALIEHLYRSRSVIANAYDHQEVDVMDGDWSSVNPLISANLMRSKGHHTVRLNRRLVSIFDQALRKNRILAINENLASLLDAAQLNTRNMLDELAEFNNEQSALYRAEAENRLLEIYDTAADDVDAIHERVTRSYGTLSNLSARKAEHELYARQLDKLQTALRTIDLALKEEPFTLDDGIREFIVNLDAESISTVIQKIQAITQKIREYLFRIRQLERKALKVRAVATHFRNNPGFVTTLTETNLQDHPFLYAVQPLPLKAMPDLSDPDIEAHCAAFVERHNTRKGAPDSRTPRGASELKSSTQASQVSKPPAIDKVIWRFFSRCLSADKPLSASQFWCDEMPTMDAELKGWTVMEWLYVLSGYLDSNPVTPNGKQRASQFVKPLYVTWPTPTLWATKDLKDIEIQRAQKRRQPNHGQISETRPQNHYSGDQAGPENSRAGRHTPEQDAPSLY